MRTHEHRAHRCRTRGAGVAHVTVGAVVSRRTIACSVAVPPADVASQEKDISDVSGGDVLAIAPDLRRDRGLVVVDVPADRDVGDEPPVVPLRAIDDGGDHGRCVVEPASLQSHRLAPDSSRRRSHLFLTAKLPESGGQPIATAAPDRRAGIGGGHPSDRGLRVEYVVVMDWV